MQQRPRKASTKVTLTVLGGTLKLRKLVLTGSGEAELERTKTLRSAAEIELTVR